MKIPTVGIIVPCYQEQDVISFTISKLSQIIETLIKNHEIYDNSFIALIDDGSSDKTWEIIEDIAKKQNNIKGLRLSRNFGHQNALLSGLITFKDKADCLISIDADLQDDINAIPKMISKFKSGFEIVYGVRKKRNSDSFFKKLSALFFYKLLAFLGGKSIYNHADYRLTSSRVIQELEKYSEINLYLRGIFPSIGFSYAIVHYDRLERVAGISKYPLKRMLAFASNGITSFSTRPLRFISLIGFVVFIISMFLTVYVIHGYFSDAYVPGWASTVLPMYLLGGIQLLSIGVLGEYLGKIYIETKRRPRYTIEKQIL